MFASVRAQRLYCVPLAILYCAPLSIVASYCDAHIIIIIIKPAGTKNEL